MKQLKIFKIIYYLSVVYIFGLLCDFIKPPYDMLRLPTAIYYLGYITYEYIDKRRKRQK